MTIARFKEAKRYKDYSKGVDNYSKFLVLFNNIIIKRNMSIRVYIF